MFEVNGSDFDNVDVLRFLSDYLKRLKTYSYMVCQLWFYFTFESLGYRSLSADLISALSSIFSLLV